MKTLILTNLEHQIVDAIVGGRFDALVEMSKAPTLPNKDEVLDDIESLRPLVEKIRSA